MKLAAIGLVLGLARAQDLGQLPPDVPCYSAWASAFGEDVLYTLTAFQPYIDCMIATMDDQYIGQPMFIGDSNIHFWRNTQGIMPTALNLGISRASCAQIAKVIGAALDHFQPSDAIVSCGGEYWWGDIWRKMEAYSYDWTNDQIASDAYADAKDLVDTLAGLNGNHAVPGILIYLTTTPYMSVNDAAYQYDNYAPLFVSYDQMVEDTDFVPAIMNGAFQQGISYVNVYEAFMNVGNPAAYYKADETEGVLAYLSSQGYDIWAPMLCNAYYMYGGTATCDSSGGYDDDDDDDDDWLGDIIPAEEMPILYADVEVCLTDLSDDGVSMASVTDGCLNTAICQHAASLGTEIESWLQSQNSLLSDLSLAALVQSGIECVCSIDTTAPEYDATLTAVIDLVEDYSEAALASFFNDEVPALIGAISGGSGLCTPECKAFASEAILVPTQYYTSSSTMAGLWAYAYEAFESLGVSGSDISWLTGMPTAFTIDMRLANIAAANLPDCLCGVDYVNLYNIIKPTVVSLVTDFESWFENDAFQISTWTAIVSSYNTAVKDTGLGFCSNTCKQGVESFLAHQLEVFMGLAGITGGIAGLGLAGYSVTDTTVSTVVTSCGCQKTEALISAAITTLESFQPLVDLLIDGIDDADDVQSVLNSVVDDDLKAHVKTILAALFADDAACATDCQNAAANLAEIGQALAFDQTTLALIVGDDFDLSEWVPSTSQAAIATAGANALPCLCADTTDPTAAVDAVWETVVETLVHDLEGLFEGGLTGQQFSSMLVAVSSVPGNMGMCASSSCTALLSAGNTLITDLHVTLDGTPPAAQCTGGQAAACMTDAAIISKSNLEDAYNAWPSLCQIQDGLTLHPIWWVGCAYETACDNAAAPGETFVASAEVIVAGSVSDYDSDEEKAPLIAAFAASVGAPPEDVSVTVEAGSVKLTFSVIMRSAIQTAAFESTMQTWEADTSIASTALSVSVTTVAPQDTITVGAPSPPATPPPESPESSSSSSNIGMIGGIAGGGVVCLVLVFGGIYYCSATKKKKDLGATSV